MPDAPSPISLEEEKFMRHARAFLKHFFDKSDIPQLTSNNDQQRGHILSKDALYKMLIDQLQTVYLWKGARDVVHQFEPMVRDAINGFQTELLDGHRITSSYVERREVNLLADKMRMSLADYLRIEQREQASTEVRKQERKGVQNDNAGNVISVDFKKPR